MKATTKEKRTTKHTPGPWHFIEGDAKRHGSSVITKAEDTDFIIGHIICESVNAEQRAEDIANARLIAAAPELMEIVQYIASWGRVGPDEVNAAREIVKRLA